MIKQTWLAAVSAIALTAFSAHAQTAPAPEAAETADGRILIYEPEFFADSNPNTALDMVNRVPGFRLENGDDVRGYAGAGGNALIDGARPASKSDTASDVLARTPASRVERIELIRGGAPGIDMQGRSVLVNVILSDEASRQHTVQGNAFVFEGGPTLYGGRYEYAASEGEHEWGVQLGRSISMSDSTGFGAQTRRGPDGAVLLEEDVRNKFDGNGWSGGANWAGPALGGRLELTGSAQDWYYDDWLIFSGEDGERRYDFTQDLGELDLGLRHERALSERLQLETRLIQNFGRADRFNGARTPGGQESFLTDRQTGESIARGVLRWTRSEAVSVEGGGELAYNYLDTEQSYTRNGAPVPLPQATTKVEELRGEVFANGTWRRSERLTLEAGARLEHSTIRQTGGGEGESDAERSFFYPKPRFAAVWSPADDHQLRLRFERELGQLDFVDFAASSSLSNEQVLGGNTDLRPQQRWISEMVYERRFWEDGVLTFTLRHDEIVDAIDVIPLEDGLTAIGNIGDGTLDRAALDVRVPLKRFGLKGGRITAEVQYDHTRVTDPSTGRTRRISGVRPLTGEVRFDNDVPAYDLNWGVVYIPYFRETTYNPDQRRYFELRDYLIVFAERKFGDGFTVSAELTVWDDFRIGRDAYADRATRELAFTERQALDPRDFLRLEARKTF